MAYRAGVVGGSGYAGAELLRLLAGHPEIEVVHVTADSNSGMAVGDLYPALLPAYEQMRFAPVDAADLTGLDLVFCALPHGASQALLPDLLDHVGHAVDLGADFRLPPDVYSRWYGEAHHAPEIADRFAYGLVELYREEIAKHTHVASPGCYPTAVSLACAPLLALGLVEPRVIADAVSGLSGAGRGLKTTSLFAEANENVSAYGLLTHRHTAEMEQALTKVARQPVQVLFTPHLVPTTRGILATCYARPATTGLSSARLLEHYREFYADDPCVVVVDEPSGTKATYGANVAHLTVRFDARTETVVAIAAEDNLVKGASGQMIQAANLLLGLPETTGLPLLGIQP
jgi:N-acetyl-gamma-glutamyl-phosphate reductase